MPMSLSTSACSCFRNNHFPVPCLPNVRKENKEEKKMKKKRTRRKKKLEA
jgi:hypothetical protein